VPKLAESFALSANAQTLTFRLRKGVTFQSGAPVTAANVITDWNMVRGPNGQDPYWYNQVTSITAGPNNTVVVKCNKPFASGPYLFRQQFANVFNNTVALAHAKTYGTAIVDGTGPFQLTSFSQQQVTAKRFENYSGSIVPFFNNKGKAYLDGIKWVALTDQPSRAAEVISGAVHVTKNPSPADLPSLQANPSLVVVQEEEAGALTFALSFKRPQLGFTDVRVRQAISQAINRDLIVKAVLFNQGTAVRGPFPTTYKWYEPGVEKFNNYNPAKAKSLLDQAGWVMGSGGVRAKNGQKLEFTIVNRSDATLNEVGQAVVQMLAKVGVSATMKNLETGAYFTALTSDPDAYFFDWLWLDFPRIYQVLASKPFFKSSTWGQMSVPQCEAAFNAWSYAANNAQLEAAARQIQLTVAQYQPILTLYVPHVVWVHSNKLHGYLPTNPNNLYPYYNDMWLAP
jgi:peptide/nickel transport system substrate-binding protein